VLHTPDWEWLADALNRVVAIGIHESEAKIELCKAVADRKIAVRVKIAASETGIPRSLFYDDNVQVPPHLKPDDFDWEQSRPRQRWPVGPVGPQSYTYPYWEWKRRQVDLVELATSDVERLFPTSLVAKAGDSAARRGGKRPRIIEYLAEHYPKGVDDPAMWGE
jgi:hypothetical protein